MQEPTPQPASEGTNAAAPTPAPLRLHGELLHSAALLQGGKSVVISHNGELYRLQTTRQGKLILTK